MILAGRRATVTLPNSVVKEYSYDAASQLTSLTYRNGSTTIGDLTYSYDQSGRRKLWAEVWLVPLCHTP